MYNIVNNSSPTIYIHLIELFNETALVSNNIDLESQTACLDDNFQWGSASVNAFIDDFVQMGK